MSFKKMSLKNIEIETCESSDYSILNRHLDEIIYFFQVTNYNLVIIEDLDRFGSPEIFVKLREINKLINDNDKTSGDVKFLYAIKDDMFAHKNRAKFFDIIIPVIPVVNSSNALDKIIKERLNDENNDIHELLKKSQLLREVSNYLNDLRLIHNIFNEFEIYYSELKNNKPDVIKLLSVIIYKNSYPRDFELLHTGEGKLSKLCGSRSKLILNKRNIIQQEIKQIRIEIKNSDKEYLSNISDLVSLYLFHISMTSGGAHGYYNKQNSLISFTSIDDEISFQLLLEQIKNDGSVRLQNQNHQNNFSKSLQEIEKQINPNTTYHQRLSNIKNKKSNNRIQLELKIHEKEREISQLNRLKLSELLLDNVDDFEKLLEEEKKINDGTTPENNELFRYLVLDGHLDEDYYLYISNFYEGRKTTNDQKFIMAVRSYNKLGFSHPIDNPSEVCLELRDADYSNDTILNVNLIDYLVKSTLIKETKKTFDFISENLQESESFMSSYFSTAVNLKEFVILFSGHFHEYAKNSIELNLSEDHLKNILSSVSIDHITSKMNTSGVITKYLNKNLDKIITGKIFGIIDKNILRLLTVKVETLDKFSDTPDWLSFIYENNLYKINPQNIKFLLPNNIELDLIENSNYTSVLTSNLETLKCYIDENINEYVEEVILEIEECTNETEPTLVRLLNNDAITESNKSKIIQRQNAKVKTITEAPKNYWLELAKNVKMAATWNNFTSLFESKVTDDSEFMQLFNIDYYAENLKNESWHRNTDIDAKGRLSSKILNAENISNKNYNLLTANLFYRYKNFPKNLSIEKLHILSKNKVIVFNEESFAFARNHDFFVFFLINNIDSYISVKKDLEDLDGEIIKKLILSEIKDSQKVILTYDLRHQNFLHSQDFAIELSKLLLDNNVSLEDIDLNVLKWVSYASKDIVSSIKLIIKSIHLWDESDIFSVVENLEFPFNRIASYGKRPKIPYTKLNLEFTTILKKNNYISSCPIKGNMIEVNTKNKK